MEAQFSVEEVIEMMKRTKKTDPLFKPLKKLKTAIEVLFLLRRGLGRTLYRSQPPKESSCFTSGSEMTSIDS
jgi:hypothetical protein